MRSPHMGETRYALASFDFLDSRIMTTLPDPRPNTPEWTVTELSGALRRTVEDAYGHVRVRGEISGYRGPHSSGHAYFSLKDEGARLDAVCWKGTFQRLKVRPEEGLEVVAIGKLTTYPGKSGYQIVIEALEFAGAGAIMAMLEERKRRLQAEGLFDRARKKPLPFLPKVVGIVTSPTGAVIRDILHRLSDRFPRHVLVWPVRVQGETSAAEVAAAIRGFNALDSGGPVPRPDVLIVARGGGSLEDLLGFSEEVVVRAAAESAIPLISAVGHETDITLIDFASDMRAPTPTAAAEMAVPVRAELLAGLRALHGRLGSAPARLLDRRRSDLRGLARLLPTADSLFSVPRQRLDTASARLPRALRANATAHRIRLERARLKPSVLSGRMEQRRARLEGLGMRLGAAHKANVRAQAVALTRFRERVGDLGARSRRALLVMLRERQRRLSGTSALLEALSYHGVLARGFALVRDSSGHAVRSVQDVSPGQGLDLQFADGKVAVTAGGTPRPAGRKASSGTAQPGLFDPPA